MLRLFAPIIVAAALFATPAAAETDWAAYGSFKSTRCEDAKTIADIRESIKGLTFNDGGGRAFAMASSVKVLQSRTVKATANTLVCLMKFRTIEAGATYVYSARHTVWIEPDGQWRTLFQPNY